MKSAKQIPQIQKYMTPMPHTIGEDIPIKTALTMMREHRIRHLPVQKAGRLVGILSDRDLKLASSLTGLGPDAEALRVDDVMTPDPYVVTPDAPLDRVVSEMADHKYGSAIVQGADGKVVGIFTAVDGLRALEDLLKAA